MSREAVSATAINGWRSILAVSAKDRSTQVPVAGKRTGFQGTAVEPTRVIEYFHPHPGDSRALRGTKGGLVQLTMGPDLGLSTSPYHHLDKKWSQRYYACF